MSEKWIIVYLGMCESDEFEGTLEEAIEHVQCDRRYRNYGRTGAQIYLADLKYEIKVGDIERRL